MVLEMAVYSALPLAAVAFGGAYTVKLVDREKDVRFTVYLFLLAALGALEVVQLWNLFSMETAAYGDTYSEALQASMSVAAAAGVYVTGRALEEEETEMKKMDQEVKELRADLQDERSRRETLEREVENFEIYDEMLSSVPDMVFALDESGGFVEANETMYQQLGFTKDQLMEQDFHSVMAQEQAGEMTAEAEEQKVLVEHEARTRDGESFPVELHMARLRGSSDVTKGIVGMARDITERKEREQQLGVLNRFFRHNVRNELTVIIGSADVLVDSLKDKEREYAERIQDRAKVLEQMSEKARTIGNLLDQRPETHVFEVRSTVERAISEFTEEDGELTVEAPENIEVEAVEGLEFAIQNVVENALEHVDEDRPQVEVRVSEDDSGRVVIEVHDDGDGIPRHEIETIAEGTENPLQHGSGIGLWAVKWIVDRSDGELRFSDSPLGGAEVSIELYRA